MNVSEEASQQDPSQKEVNQDKKDGENKAIRDLIIDVIKRQSVPTTNAELEAYVADIRNSVYKKYDGLLKNVHQYLCYMYLISYNYQKCIDHGEILLEFENLQPTTKYNVHSYLAEAHCMLSQFEQSLSHLQDAERVSDQAVINEANQEPVRNLV